MSLYDPRSWLDKFVGACASLLAGIMALFWAVRLLQAIAVPLLISVAVCGVIGLAPSRSAVEKGNDAHAAGGQ